MSSRRHLTLSTGGIVVLTLVILGVGIEYMYGEKLGLWFADFMGETSPFTSKKRLDEECRKGDSDSCTELANQLRRQLDNPPDENHLAEVINQYQRACKLGEYESCRWAGQLLLKGRTPDLRRAERLLHKACEGLDKKGCILLDDVRARRVPPPSSL